MVAPNVKETRRHGTGVRYIVRARNPQGGPLKIKMHFSDEQRAVRACRDLVLTNPDARTPRVVKVPLVQR